jgi:hypothetical protein
MRISWRQLALITLVVAGSYFSVRWVAHRYKNWKPFLHESFYLGRIMEGQGLEGDPRWEARPLTEAEKEQIVALIDRRYHFLHQGRQSYAFVSEDGRTVLKTIKFQHLRPRRWLDLFSWIPPLNRYRLEQVAQMERKRRELYESWLLAFNRLQPETGLICMHLNPTEQWLPRTTLVDAKGFELQVDLNQLVFALQHRAQMMKPVFQQLLDEARLDEARLLLDRFLALLLSEYRRGLSDDTHAFWRNLGVIDGHPIQIDLGKLAYNESYRVPKVYERKLGKSMFHLRRFLSDTSPELREHLEAQLAGLGLECRERR